MELLALLDQLEHTQHLSKEEWVAFLSGRTPALAEELFQRARAVQEKHYGKQVYIRGLIEFTNYCKNDCYYCGIRRSNQNANRYRLTKGQILDCCKTGYDLGFRTFVLQGGEDGYFTDTRLVEIVRAIREEYPDCAITLSVGERSKESYQALYDAGANRYLLRHETYDCNHYGRLHPPQLSAKERQECLWNLKEVGFQVGTGFMVGSPGQTYENLAEDLLFLEKLSPQMVGIGPFIPHHDTPFRNEQAGGLELTLFLLGCIRLLLPKVLLPSTTALGTIAPDGRERGILAGANVVMPNLSPIDVRKSYLLYDNKICTGDEAAESLASLKKSMERIGYTIPVDRGDSKNIGG
jgi:biotin synthase